MTRIFKIIAMLAMLAAVVAMPAFAQTSPTSSATAGIFTTQVEDSMDVHNYGDVQFEKWAGFIGLNNGFPSIGYAFKPGGIYLGLWYNGNAVTFSTTESETVQNTYNYNDQIKTRTVTTSGWNNMNITSNNSIQALIGVAGMGIKVGFNESLTTREKPNNFNSTSTTEDFLNSTVTYQNVLKSYSYANGNLFPSVEWGMKIGNIKPRAELSLNISLNNETTETQVGYTTSNGAFVGPTKTTNITAINSDFLVPSVALGADIDLSEKTTVGAMLNFSMAIYDKSYDYYGVSGSVAGNYTSTNISNSITESLTTKTTTKNVNLTIAERSSMSFGITPSFTHINEIAENFKLGFSAEVPVSVTISSEKSDYAKNYTSTKIEYLNDSDKFRNTTTITEAVGNTAGNTMTTDSTQIIVRPVLGIGAVYGLIPNRFSVNAGVGIRPCVFTNTTIKQTTLLHTTGLAALPFLYCHTYASVQSLRGIPHKSAMANNLPV